ncbi:CDP-diacylglycerol--glycerol-3-phosphate 3-phosphatidyltransferase [Kaustia mangrovi]|uniref:CDP-diacylglycerol--glycerol-3-phosphate 3-phosphatidyltransferase n=1 Tax=Kaustia mangrovi TaxID=2593653 RepID=A0A7S8HED5_9HYPH|nr:CDP-diacylglycerol--glycerol-3-phosphate 3-phosphatidyltransferase [Kaustia mangrovi]QPC45389.1 CDP-diacylglycerol--glycerol-3-phosphate 3-phosphatidyltransferase [Kaustia mangrovi]
MNAKPPHAHGSAVLSLPNILTLGRIAAVPALVVCFFFEGMTARWVALGIFIAAGVTDFFDGYLARLWSQQSALGRMLDPIADKLLVAVTLLMLAAVGTIYGIHIWAAVVILSREVLVSGLREFLAELRVSVPVTELAKWKTTIQLVAIGILIAGPAADEVFAWTSFIGLTGLWVAAILTLYTGYDYLKSGLDYLMEDDGR